MLLKTSVVLERPRAGVLRVSSHLISADLAHPALTSAFVDTLSITRDPQRALERWNCDAAFGDNFMAFLQTHRLLYEFDPGAKVIDAAHAAEVLSRDLDYWADTLYCDEFWDRIASNDPAHANSIYAWAVENYHHTHGVLRHLGAVLAHVRDRKIVDKCLTHMSEEWDHPYLFRLCASRFREANGRPSLPGSLMPLGSTEALCNVLRLAARKHVFVYKSCVAVLEKTARRVQETRDFFRNVAMSRNMDYAVVEPLVRHAETDEGFDHLNSLQEFAELCPTLPISVVRDAVRLAFAFAESLYLWQHHLMDWYLGFPAGEGERVRRFA